VISRQIIFHFIHPPRAGRLRRAAPATRDVGHPEVAGSGFAAAGLEISDGGLMRPAGPTPSGHVALLLSISLRSVRQAGGRDFASVLPGCEDGAAFRVLAELIGDGVAEAVEAAAQGVSQRRVNGASDPACTDATLTGLGYNEAALAAWQGDPVRGGLSSAIRLPDGAIPDEPDSNPRRTAPSTSPLPATPSASPSTGSSHPASTTLEPEKTSELPSNAFREWPMPLPIHVQHSDCDWPLSRGPGRGGRRRGRRGRRLRCGVRRP
jgi:hypothetical protein